MRKIIVMMLMAVLVLSSLTPLQANAADDLTGYMYEKEMRELIELGVLNGYPDGTYKPRNEVTRAEFAKMVIKSFELETKVESAEFVSAATNEVAFKDVPMDKWYAVPVMEAANTGIVLGFPDGTFKPDDLITREQMATMISRALKVKGVMTDLSNVPALSFKDTKSIHGDHKEDVRLLNYLEILKGHENNTFDPKGNSARWMVALVMLRSRDIVFPPKSMEFQATAIKDGKTSTVKEFETFAEAKKYVGDSSKAQLVERSSQILWMEGEGLAVANAFTEVFPSSSLKTDWNTKYRPYVTTNAEMKYLDSTEKYVKLELAGKVGYVPASTVVLIPKQLQKGQSYYEKSSNGGLVHRIFTHSTGKYTSSKIVGKAPSAFTSGVKYHSWDGSTFYNEQGKKVTEAHQYFNKLPLMTKSTYTAKDFDRYFEENFPHYNKDWRGKYWEKSPLVGTGKFFKEVEEKYKVNALYLVSHAVHESDWGTSKIAQDKYNLFGLKAVDGDAYNQAVSYKSFKESIVDIAEYLNASYQNVSGTNYNGSILGNKALGMNVRYASDHFWGEGIAGHMYQTDIALGSKDFNKYTLGYTNIEGLNFRNAAGATSAASKLYQLQLKGIPVVITGKTTVSGAIWYKVLSENKAYQDAYVYGSGSKGEYIKALPIAK